MPAVGHEAPGESLEETVCRVCGQDDGTLLRDGYGVPLYVICDCCGIESGLGDDHLSKVRETRGYWVADGARWDVPSRRPENWDLLEQLSHIPAEWR
ncbi:hypothetical protein PV396_30600 [Streptomyces sp. ME02-8801-2C]|uniref:hypothetical protein n=1 Tax=Streptomyces sp. ME02-8801-2C TaxID=3028680 RepID=UPI0029AA2E3C|nr:hypothetical protein [Streptomyces sp. ME02-8801-2C]MDX3456240.1 hypothetical protein [Streptomyces sp. ME02-8801-2C]